MDNSDAMRSTQPLHGAARAVLDGLAALGVPHGSELSLKLGPHRLLRDRLLVGMQRAALDEAVLFAFARSLGLPAAAQQTLTSCFARANAVFLATEDDGPHRMFKLYVEFWDEVRARVRAGERSAQLLHLGVKWTDARPGHHEEARYLCHPLLSARDVLRRMRDVYPPDAQTSALRVAQDIVRCGLRKKADAGLLYLEVSEAGNPRRSFDVNLYKTDLRVEEAAGPLRQAAAHFGVADAFEPVLEELAPLPLGHIAGGIDRHGREFLSVYAELAPLPDAADGGNWSER